MSDQDNRLRTVAAASGLHAMGAGMRGSKSLMQSKQQKQAPKEGERAVGSDADTCFTRAECSMRMLATPLP
jgi:hypothetical protein